MFKRAGVTWCRLLAFVYLTSSFLERGSDGAVKPGLGILGRKSAVALGSGAGEQEAELFKDQTLKTRKQ